MARDYPSQPIVGVGAIVFRDDAVLLIRRGTPPRQGSWTLPGGCQQIGETVAAAARRELREETGLEVVVKDVVAVVDLIDRDDDGRARHHFTVIDLLAEWTGGEAVAGDDAAAVAWVAEHQLARYQLTDDVLRVIALARAKRRHTTA